MRESFPNLNGRRVLVVDPARGVAESIAALVRHMGCEARVCETGEEALSLARAWRPELVVMDLLCSPNALVCLRQVQELSGSCAAVMVYSAVETDPIREARSTGLTVLPKPVPAEKLLAICDYLLELS